MPTSARASAPGSIQAVTRWLARPRHRQGCAAVRQVAQPLAAAALVLALHAPGADAAGLEAIDLPVPNLPNMAGKVAERSAQTLQEAEEAFQNSDLLAILKENSDANRDKNKRAIEEKYCQRQGEMGVGDCGGLRFIPGATKGGKQKTPGWLAGLLGIQQAEEEDVFEFSMTAPKKAAAEAAQSVAEAAPAVAAAAPDVAEAAPDAAKAPAAEEVPQDPEVQAAVEILKQNDEPPAQIEGVLDAIESP